jgi:hypothetical protein
VKCGSGVQNPPNRNAEQFCQMMDIPKITCVGADLGFETWFSLNLSRPRGGAVRQMRVTSKPRDCAWLGRRHAKLSYVSGERAISADGERGSDAIMTFPDQCCSSGRHRRNPQTLSPPLRVVMSPPAPRAVNPSASDWLVRSSAWHPRERRRPSGPRDPRCPSPHSARQCSGLF